MMDEEEYEQYLDMIDRVDDRLRLDADEGNVFRPNEQLRDDHGIRVPGCYRVPPRLTE